MNENKLMEGGEGCNFPEAIFRAVLFLGENLPGSNFPGDIFRTHFSGDNFSRGHFSGGIFPSTQDNMPCFNTKHNFFKYSFFPSTIIGWDKLNISLLKCNSFNVFKKESLKSIRPSSNSFYNCQSCWDQIYHKNSTWHKSIARA